MTGFCRMEEEGGCASRCEAGGDLLADMTRLADAGDNHIVIRRHDQVCRANDGLVESGFKLLKRVALDADDIARKFDFRLGFQGRLPRGFTQRRLPEWEGSSSLGRVFDCV